MPIATAPAYNQLIVFIFVPFVISWLSWLPDNLRNRHAVHIGEPCVAAVKPVSELLMIDPQQLQNRCVQIVIRNRLLLRLLAELVTGSNCLPNGSVTLSSSPYSFRVASDSRPTSSASGAQLCIRNANSYDEMRAARSELPGYCCMSISFSFASRSSRARCCSALTPEGGFRSTIGSPADRNSVPWYAAGM